MKGSEFSPSIPIALNSFNKDLLIPLYMPGTVLHARDLAESKSIHLTNTEFLLLYAWHASMYWGYSHEQNRSFPLWS